MNNESQANNPAFPFAERQLAIAEIIDKSKTQAFLISHLSHIRYLTGFSGSSAFLLAERKGAYVLFTDFRYKTQAETELTLCPNLDLVIVTKDYLDEVGGELSARHITRLAFQSRSLTCFQLGELNRKKPGLSMHSLPDACEKLIRQKGKAEIDSIRQAAMWSDSLFPLLRKWIRSGNPEKWVAAHLELEARLSGGEGCSFPPILATGPHAALPHASPTERTAKPGDTIIADYGTVCRGFCSDMTRTFMLGDADPELSDIYDIVLGAQQAALKIIRPGIPCAEVDRAARDFISREGYAKRFGHGTGHGVGIEVHEEPQISARSTSTLESGMVITVEPGIYLPGKGGVRIEDMVVVTKEGCQNLVSSPKQRSKTHIDQ